MNGWRGRMDKPSQQLLAYINYGVSTSPAVASWARLYIYRRACAVLASGDLQARREALQKEPDHIRDKVEHEARRIHFYRKVN